MDIDNFGVIEEEFAKRVRKIVWCTFTTIDRNGRPRSRILHPIWEGNTGWIATGRNTLKSKHLAQNPYVSLSYWDPDHEQVYADCKAQWNDDSETKERVWSLLKSTPGPVGYDPESFWKNPQDPGYGVLKLTPWRIELWGLQAMSTGQPPKVWRQEIE